MNQPNQKEFAISGAMGGAVPGAVAMSLDASGNPKAISDALLVLQAAQVVAIGSSSTSSSAVQATTNRVLLTSTVDCWVAWSASPTAAVATSGSIFLAASCQTRPIGVIPGVTVFAVISNTSSTGYLSIFESS